MTASLIRTLLVLLLAAAQLAAPLVHAHVGGEAVAGKVHLPGLEALGTQPDQPYAQADEKGWEPPGLVVGIASGLQSKQSISIPCSQPALAVAPAPAAHLARTPPPALPPTSHPPATAQPRLEQAAPRAPPSHPFA